MRSFLYIFVCLLSVQNTWAQETSSSKPEFMQWTENVQIDPQLWEEALASVRERLSTKRSGSAGQTNNDIYDLAWVDLIQTENLDFQIYAVWIDLSIGAKFKDENRGLTKVLERLQSETSIEQTEKFLEEYCYTLSDMEQNCGVNAQFIGGIVNIETFFGSYDGVVKFPTLATLVSWVAMQDERFRDHVLQQYYTAIDLAHNFTDNQTDKVFISGSRFVNKNTWISRANNRANKSLVQLRDFLNLAHSMQWQEQVVLDTHGSWVGAFTPAQFMPTTLRSILKAEENIDPNSLTDIIPMMGRYLALRWGESRSQIDRAIRSYNSPVWYREHVFNVADQTIKRWQELIEENNKN
ncbi:MAG TPA: lytic murein transglycosylase [Oligoflexia bacterium]|nr:lytic murein transglycosylase [Oligoflexia bacterium]HMR25031.1 lytic murein transglycosylase [Oligoflexia bacterium]